jgi:glycosyltransferase involved in cell wall biosynthesis
MTAETRLWITWNDQVRNRGLSAALHCELKTLNYESLGRSGRYLMCAAVTVWELLRRRYDHVFAQCPSIVCTALLGVLKNVRRYKLVIDAHNVTFEYPQKSRILRWLVRYSFHQADYVIVSNDLLAPQVEQLGSIPVVLPDRLPQIPSQPMPPQCQLGQKHTITFVCSFQTDEPVDELLSGLQQLPKQYKVFVTGNRRLAGPHLKYESDQIIFTGFMPRCEFDGLLRHSDLLIDLTTRPDCLVCGAYEALAVGVPAVLSDHPPLRALFSRGFLFAENNAQSYYRCVEKYFEDPQHFRSEIDQLKQQFVTSWNASLRESSQLLFGEPPRDGSR